MKTAYSFIALWLCIITGSAVAETCPIIPQPATCQKNAGTFNLNSRATVAIRGKASASQAYYLQKEVLRLTGIALAENTVGKSPAIELNLIPGRADGEAYTLQIQPAKVTISSASAEGLFNGIESFLQLALFSPNNGRAVQIPCWNISDKPLYGWRGIMLDESRHFFGKEVVKNILDWMAFYKLNRFHWHLTDEPGWRFEVKRYPKLALVGGIGDYSNPAKPAQFYTQEDIKEIVSYAAERFIEVIPEVDMPGHATAANKAYPAYSGGGSAAHPDFTFNPGKEGTYAFLTNILKETDALFPSQMIHLGGDEVSYGNEKWATDSGIQALRSKYQLKDLKAVEDYFIQRMADSVFVMNNKVLAWDEAVSTNLPANKTIVLWWRHDKPQQLKMALDKKYSVVLCPRIPLYFDFVQDSTHQVGRRWAGDFASLTKLYNFSGTEYIPNAGNNSLLLGMQANLWTEKIATTQRLEYMLFPRIAALAESAWTAPANKDFGQFKNRLNPHLALYKASGLSYFNALDAKLTPEIIDPAAREQKMFQMLDK
ncbi:beta-N-acetylhexosaminidase [Pedobacter sp. BS3]|uniref:beta-N-acetylhexosaminidase n=1 Tax=Pedobacter sp. BS3 TaxID=2567937 RepID=UPI0011EBE719|nr:beta-N-acetylhexosaminidase [Pedobacter sp. BS3]TZF82594.1 beta-N-acetylhexosaminidase [Pedobacter sp. BS3]